MRSKTKNKEEVEVMISNQNNIFIPIDPYSITKADILHYLENIKKETAQDIFTQGEKVLLKKVLYEKFLNQKNLPFFLYHFLPIWEYVVKVIFKDSINPKIIEIGCGSGTSSLLFALLGAKVIGIDLDRTLIEICYKRKLFYENFYKKNINVCFYDANVFNFSFKSYAPIDIFFSLFAFNLMQPSNTLLQRIIPSLKHGGKIIIVDGNRKNIYNFLKPSRQRMGVLSPKNMKKELENLGCRVIEIRYQCIAPPFALRNLILKALTLKIENILKKLGLHKYLSISYTIIAEKI